MRAKLEALATSLWWRPLTAAALWPLWPLAQVYRALVAARRLAYRRGWLPSWRAPVPVVVVGNLVVGGAGKTPTVIALVQVLRGAGYKPGIVSRGHGRAAHGHVAAQVNASSSPEEVGDEPVLMARRTGVPVWVSRNRCLAVQQLLTANPEVNLVVCDDGLQHLALAHDAAIAVFDDRGAGNGQLLPMGPLREPMAAQSPNGMLVLYNASQPSTPWPGSCAHRTLLGATPLAQWRQGEAGSMANLIALRGMLGLHAAAGIGNPQRFFDMLLSLGLQFEPHALPDHHDFNKPAWPPDAQHVLVTEKDAVKLQATPASHTAIWVVTLDFALPAELIANLLNKLPRP